MLSALARRDLGRFKKVIIKHLEAGRRDYQQIFSLQQNWHLRPFEDVLLSLDTKVYTEFIRSQDAFYKALWEKQPWLK
jgi:hypothetical protein